MENNIINPFGWEVKTEEIVDIRGNVIKSHKNLVRDDNNESIYVMGNRYSPLKNADLHSYALKLQEEIGLKIEEHLDYNNGRVVLVGLSNPKEDLVIAGYQMKRKIVLGNSFDGTKPIFLGTSNFYPRCTNQFGHIVKAMSIRHSRTQLHKMDEMLSVIMSYFKQEKELVELYNHMHKVEFDDNVLNMLIDVVLDIDKDSKEASEEDKEMSTRKQNQIISLRGSIEKETSELGNNLWGLFNGVTHFTTHKTTKRKGSPEDKYTLFNGAAKKNEKAFKFLKEQAVLA